jgi:hypothetical protein
MVDILSSVCGFYLYTCTIWLEIPAETPEYPPGVRIFHWWFIHETLRYSQSLLTEMSEYFSSMDLVMVNSGKKKNIIMIMDDNEERLNSLDVSLADSYPNYETKKGLQRYLSSKSF